MQKRIAIKNHYREIQLLTRRALLAALIMFLLLLGLITRLVYLQIIKHEMYTTLATNNWLDLVPIEPTRGLVYDRNGVMLAENIPVFSLDIIPYKVPNMKATLLELQSIIQLNNDDLLQFKKQLRQHRRFDEIPLKIKLTEEEVARFAENQYRLPGVLIKARLMRYYPYGESFSHVLGYVGRINAKELQQIDTTNYSASHYIGKSGIEKYYEDELHGKVGYEQVENDASGKPLRVLKEIKGTPGSNIYLTIDSKLQFAAEKALDGHRGAIVAIEPATGQVLAMVSQPGFDPNVFVTGVSQEDYDALQHSPDKPLYDRALRGLYPLASTIKPYFALQGLETNTITEFTRIYDPGWFELPNYSRPFRDWRKGGHGTVDVEKAIEQSCDTFFYTLASRMGIKRMDDILYAFGFGQLTGIDLDGELPGVVASPEWKLKTQKQRWYPGDTINAGIGQGYMQATPLQLAQAVATLANRGKRFMPYLMLGEQLPGKAYVTQQPISLEPVPVHDPENWEAVIIAMQEVVSSPSGTAYGYFGRGYNYTVAGKTGTAQVIGKRAGIYGIENQDNVTERFRDHHLFIAFAPIDHPKLALAIISENSNEAAKAARQIFDYYLGSPPDAARATDTQTQ